MFEENFHGVPGKELEAEHRGLAKAESAGSTSSVSVDDGEHAKKA